MFTTETDRTRTLPLSLHCIDEPMNYDPGEWNRTPPTAVIKNGVIGTGPMRLMQVVARVHRLAPRRGQVISRYISIGADQADQHCTCLVRLPSRARGIPPASSRNRGIVLYACFGLRNALYLY